MKNSLKRFLKEEDGVGVVEIVLILAVIVGLAIIFKSEITRFVTTIFESIFAESSKII